MQDTNATATVQHLLDYFDRLIPLNKDEKDLIKATFQPHLFIKKQFVLWLLSTLLFAFLKVRAVDAYVRLADNWRFILLPCRGYFF